MEDISVLKSLPNLQIICPGDKLEVKEALIKAYNSGKPTYIRLGKKGEPVVHEKKPNFKIGRSIYLKRKRCCVIRVGNALPIALKCEETLLKQNINCDLISYIQLSHSTTNCWRDF